MSDRDSLAFDGRMSFDAAIVVGEILVVAWVDNGENVSEKSRAQPRRIRLPARQADCSFSDITF